MGRPLATIPLDPVPTAARLRTAGARLASEAQILHTDRKAAALEALLLADEAKRTGVQRLDLPDSELAYRMSMNLNHKLHVRHSPRHLHHELRTVHSQIRLFERLQGQAAADAMARQAPHVLADYVTGLANIVANGPIRADNDVLLTGDDALKARAELYNEWFCKLVEPNPINGETKDERLVDAARTVYFSEEMNYSGNLEEAKEQMVDMFDNEMRAIGRRLFMHDGPQNENQVKATELMHRQRQWLGYELERATDLDTAEEKTAARIREIQRISVPWSPQWVPVNDTNEVDYTKGDTPWSQVVSVRNTGTSPTDHGPLSVMTLNDPQFQAAVAYKGNVTSPEGASVTITRRGDGHPEPETYFVTLVARNFNGPAHYTLTIKVA